MDFYVDFIDFTSVFLKKKIFCNKLTMTKIHFTDKMLDKSSFFFFFNRMKECNDQKQKHK